MINILLYTKIKIVLVGLMKVTKSSLCSVYINAPLPVIIMKINTNTEQMWIFILFTRKIPKMKRQQRDQPNHKSKHYYTRLN